MRFKPYLRLDELAYSVPNDYRRIVTLKQNCRKLMLIIIEGYSFFLYLYD